MPGYFSERRCKEGRKRSMNRRHAPPQAAEPTEVCDELAYYLGPLHRHFGHAVVESSTRLWFYPQARCLAPQGRLPLVVMPPADTPEHLRRFEVGDLADWQRALLELYGVAPEAVRFVRAPVHYRRLIVPAQAWLWGGKPTRRAAVASSPPRPHRAGDDRQDAQQGAAGRVYLVRGPELFWRGAVAGEGVVREFFRAHGYVLFDPLSVPLAQQVAVLHRASHVFGVQGSAFHLFNLAGNTTVSVGCLGRLGVHASRSFSGSLEPFVGRFLMQSPDGADASPDPSRSATKYRLALHQDVKRLLSFLISFDPDLRVDRFDQRAYGLAIAADRERFRLGDKRP
jgi:hypothetical protein